MFKASIFGLESWSGAKLLPGSQFGVFIEYSAIPSYQRTGAIGPFLPHLSSVTVKGISDSAPTVVQQEYHAATVRQQYEEAEDGTLSIVVTVNAKAAFSVFGLSRIHFDCTGFVECYPVLDFGTLFTFGRGALYPSQFSRVQGGRLISAASTVYVDINCDARNVVLWERYPDSHYAMHVIVDHKMAEGDSFVFRIRLRNQPFRHAAQPNELRQTAGRPILMCCRAMAERVSPENPYGWVSINLVTDMPAYIGKVIAACKRHNGLGIIGWPWCFSPGFGLQDGKHNYPYNAFDVPQDLRAQLVWAEQELASHGLLLGGLYRPMYHRVNSRAAKRFGDRTALSAIEADFFEFKPQLLYLDDCGTDMHSQPLSDHHTSDLIWMLGEMRKKYGPEPLWFVEHPTAASLPYAGGYIRLERQGSKLVPNIGEAMLDTLVARFPRASWLVDWQPWSDSPSQEQFDVMQWCARRGGNFSPLVKDYLVGAH